MSWPTWRARNPIQKGHCHGSPICPNPPKGRLCPRHRALDLKSQNERRALRRRLGFCIFCTARTAPGHTRCEKHLKDIRDQAQTTRDRKAAKRGWKLVRVPVREAADGKRRSAGRPR